MAFPIYIQADTADFDGPLDLRRSATPEFWAGSSVEFRIGVFEFGTIRDVGDLASVTVEVKAKNSKNEAPAPGAAPLMTKTVTGLDNDTTEAEWYAYTHCHALLAFTAEESAIPAGTHWLVVTALTNGADPQTLTLCAGDIVVAEDGHGVVGEVPVENGQAYTKAASDARYARIAEDGALYVDASSGDDATAQHGRADLPYATLAAAFASGEAGDCVLVMPGAYAAATLSTALRVEFMPGARLAGSLTLAVSGARLSGILDVDPAAANSITASSAVSADIDGSLSVNRPVAAAVTLSGGIFMDKSASAFLHPGLTGNEDSLALPRVATLESALSAESVSLSSHKANTANPHGVTKAQVGLGNVDNVSVNTWIAKHTLGTCNTAQATTEKVVTLANYALQVGDEIVVSMTYGAATSATLNVNGTGAVAVYDNGAAATAGSWAAGDLCLFLYGGSCWHLIATKAAGAASPVLHINKVSGVLNVESSIVCGGNLSINGWFSGSSINVSGPIAGTNIAGSGWVYTLANHSGYAVPSLTASILGRNLGGDGELDLVAARTATGLAGGVRFYDSVSGTTTLVFKVVNGALTGGSANTLYLGTASVPCAGGYTQTALTVTSAREAKTAIRSFTAAELAISKAIVRTCPRVYQLATSVAEKGAVAARLHSGCVYEEVYQAFLTGGLDPDRYSIFCASPRQKKTSRTETREIVTVADGRAVVTTRCETVAEPVYETLPMVDSAGNPLLDADGNPRTYQAPAYETDESGAVKMDKGLRYEELQIWIAAGLRELAGA
jgi:hypothetical protein